ncbi:hypothetical protein HDV05_002530 [Chytridiales sp. JEL 0842]|nr:hypothetical protein HDV05_002530 [Chytridiales sp. JEL 0842]
MATKQPPNVPVCNVCQRTGRAASCTYVRRFVSPSLIRHKPSSSASSTTAEGLSDAPSFASLPSSASNNKLLEEEISIENAKSFAARLQAIEDVVKSITTAFAPPPSGDSSIPTVSHRRDSTSSSSSTQALNRGAASSGATVSVATPVTSKDPFHADRCTHSTTPTPRQPNTQTPQPPPPSRIASANAARHHSSSQSSVSYTSTASSVKTYNSNTSISHKPLTATPSPTAITSFPTIPNNHLPPSSTTTFPPAGSLPSSSASHTSRQASNSTRLNTSKGSNNEEDEEEDVLTPEELLNSAFPQFQSWFLAHQEPMPPIPAFGRADAQPSSIQPTLTQKKPSSSRQSASIALHPADASKQKEKILNHVENAFQTPGLDYIPDNNELEDEYISTGVTTGPDGRVWRNASTTAYFILDSERDRLLKVFFEIHTLHPLPYLHPTTTLLTASTAHPSLILSMCAIATLTSLNDSDLSYWLTPAPSPGQIRQSEWFFEEAKRRCEWERPTVASSKALVLMWFYCTFLNPRKKGQGRLLGGVVVRSVPLLRLDVDPEELVGEGAEGREWGVLVKEERRRLFWNILLLDEMDYVMREPSATRGFWSLSHTVQPPMPLSTFLCLSPTSKNAEPIIEPHSPRRKGSKRTDPHTLLVQTFQNLWSLQAKVTSYNLSINIPHTLANVDTMSVFKQQRVQLDALGGWNEEVEAGFREVSGAVGGWGGVWAGVKRGFLKEGETEVVVCLRYGKEGSGTRRAAQAPERRESRITSMEVTESSGEPVTLPLKRLHSSSSLSSSSSSSSVRDDLETHHNAAPTLPKKSTTEPTSSTKKKAVPFLVFQMDLLHSSVTLQLHRPRFMHWIILSLVWLLKKAPKPPAEAIRHLHPTQPLSPSRPTHPANFHVSSPPKGFNSGNEPEQDADIELSTPSTSMLTQPISDSELYIFPQASTFHEKALQEYVSPELMQAHMITNLIQAQKTCHMAAEKVFEMLFLEVSAVEGACPPLWHRSFSAESLSEGLPTNQTTTTTTNLGSSSSPTKRRYPQANTTTPTYLWELFGEWECRSVFEVGMYYFTLATCMGASKAYVFQSEESKQSETLFGVKVKTVLGRLRKVKWVLGQLGGRRPEGGSGGSGWEGVKMMEVILGRLAEEVGLELGDEGLIVTAAPFTSLITVPDPSSFNGTFTPQFQMMAELDMQREASKFYSRLEYVKLHANDTLDPMASFAMPALDSQRNFAVVVGPYISVSPNGTIKAQYTQDQILYSTGNVAVSGFDPAPSKQPLGAGYISLISIGCIVAVLAVVGLLTYRRYRSSQASNGSGGKLGLLSGKPAKKNKESFAASGVPVWEMGQWRVVRAEDWAAMNADDEEMADEESGKMTKMGFGTFNKSKKEKKKDVENAVDYDEEKDLTEAQDDEQQSKSTTGLRLDHLSSFLPTRHRNNFTTSALTSDPLPTSDIDMVSSTAPQPVSLNLMESSNGSTAVASEEEEDNATAIPYNYSMLSELSGGDESIHRA